MKREYTKPSSKIYAISSIRHFATSGNVDNTEGVFEADSKKQGPSMWEDMDEE